MRAAILVALIVAAASPGIAGAQALGRASAAVRGHGGGGAVVAGRGGGASGGAIVGAGGAVRGGGAGGGGAGGGGVRGGVVVGGGGGRVVAGGWSRGVVAAPQGSPAVVPRDPPARSGTPGVPAWGFGGGVAIVRTPRDLGATVVAQDPRPVRRDDFAGGGGVRATGPIGIAALPPRPALPFFARPLTPVDVPRPERIRARVGIDAQYVLARAARLGVDGVIELPSSVDVVLAYAGYGEPNGSGFDALAIGRLGIAWRFAAERWLTGRVGVDARHFQDWLGAQLGVEALLTLDVRLADEIVLSLSGAAGTLGSAWCFEARATLAVDLDGIRLFAGWDQLALQPFESDAPGAELSGPIAGLSVPVD